MSSFRPNSAYLLIVMGVSGCGKSTVGKALSCKLGAVFIEADDFHSDAAKAKMAGGEPLTDADREPWIDRLLEEVKKHYPKPVVLAYSGLRKAHRDRFRGLPIPKKFIHLHPAKALLEQRLLTRTEHFMPARLLDSQFAALQSTSNENDIIQMGKNMPKEQMIERIMYELFEI